MNVKEIEVKSIITKSNLPATDFVINPYIGCEHSCKYCYADFMKRFTGHSSEKWGKFVDVKVNAPEKINKLKVPKDSLILFGSVTDPYQRIESKYKITQKCLKKLLEYQPRIEILTKSPLILRDLKLLKEFKNLKVGISIGILDESYARYLEPCVASPLERVKTIKELSLNGIDVFLFMSPIFPEFSDIQGLLDLLKKDINQAMFENLNIRKNNIKEIMNFVEKTKPELKDFYLSLQKNKSYWNNLEKEIRQECKKREIKPLIFFHHSETKNLEMKNF